jgi:putative SOS response-associated peptidase YedK
MCGRFVRYTPVERFAELFQAHGTVAAQASYNIAPSSRILVARNTPDGQRELALLKWGLVPAWSDEPKTAYSTINARAETVAEKPAYRSAFRHRRCLIAADGFYEWHPQPDGHKQPYFIHLANDEPFAFAGIWEHWERDGKMLESCSIIVTAANEWMQPIHDRMPVILPPDAYAAWLDPGITDPERLQLWLRPYPAAMMARHPVSTFVNSPRHEGPDLLQPVSLGSA